MTTVRIAGVQLDIELAAPENNLTNMERAIRETAARGARLVAFPECALAGYCFDSLEEARPFAEPIPGPSTERIAETCRQEQTHVVYGLLEADGERLFNASVLVGPEGLVGAYRKAHLPFLGIDRFTTPGDRPFGVQQAGALRIGMNICYDSSFPEAARVMALQGADLVVLPTNWPPGAECMADCIVMARAVENHIYYMAVNRVGDERGFSFIGHSKIAGPDGKVVAAADHREPTTLYADLDLEWPRNKRIVRVPHKHEIHRFRDRRPDLYGPLCDPVDPGDHGSV